VAFILATGLHSTVVQAIDLEDYPAAQQLIDEIVAEHGVNRATVSAIVADATYQESIIKAITRPAERMPWYRYRPIFITDGIASNKLTRIYSQSEGLQVLQAQQKLLQAASWISWNHSNMLKRRLMAECLVPNQVEPQNIQKFIVANQNVADLLRIRLPLTHIRKLIVATDIGSDIFTPAFN